MAQRADDWQPTILVVDDDDDARESLSELLRAEGFEVEAARDGVEALDYLNAAPSPVAMVLDMDMPRLRGDEVLRRVRQTPALAGIPVCVLSGHAEHVGQADLVVRKPLLVSRLATVQRWLDRCRATFKPA